MNFNASIASNEKVQFNLDTFLQHLKKNYLHQTNKTLVDRNLNFKKKWSYLKYHSLEKQWTFKRLCGDPGVCRSSNNYEKEQSEIMQTQFTEYWFWTLVFFLLVFNGDSNKLRKNAIKGHMHDLLIKRNESASRMNSTISFWRW